MAYKQSTVVRIWLASINELQKPSPNPLFHSQRSQNARIRAINIVEQVANGSSFVEIAQQKNISAVRIYQLFKKGIRVLLHPSRKTHPLRLFAENPQWKGKRQWKTL